jgi:glutamate transport system permease protein
VPVLIMMIFAYFLYAQYDVFPPKHLALAGVVTGLTLYNSAVIAEILRAGITRTATGPIRGGRVTGPALGSDDAQYPAPSHHVDAPRADLAVGGGAQGHGHRYQITFVEMVRQGTVVGSSYGNYIPALIVIALLMIAVNCAVLAGGAFGAPVAALAAGPRPLDAQAIEQEGAPGARVERAD